MKVIRQARFPSLEACLQALIGGFQSDYRRDQLNYVSIPLSHQSLQSAIRNYGFYQLPI